MELNLVASDKHNHWKRVMKLVSEKMKSRTNSTIGIVQRVHCCHSSEPDMTIQGEKKHQVRLVLGTVMGIAIIS